MRSKREEREAGAPVISGPRTLTPAQVHERAMRTYRRTLGRAIYQQPSRASGFDKHGHYVLHNCNGVLARFEVRGSRVYQIALLPEDDDY